MEHRSALSSAVLDIPGETAQQRPNAVILGYPVITAGEFAHRGSFVQLAGSEDKKRKSPRLSSRMRFAASCSQNGEISKKW